MKFEEEKVLRGMMASHEYRYCASFLLLLLLLFTERQAAGKESRPRMREVVCFARESEKKKKTGRKGATTRISDASSLSDASREGMEWKEREREEEG